jgi:CRP-like cAMP-binding protein
VTRQPSAMSQQSPWTFLHILERLGSLAPDDLRHIEHLAAEDYLVEPRRKIIDDGRRLDHVFIVKSGWLAEFKQLRDGGRQILNFRLPGDMAGIDCIVYETALQSTVALTPCVVARVSRGAFEETQRDYPRVARALLLLTLRYQAILNNWTVNLGRRPAFARIAHLLLELTRRLQIRGLAAGPIVPFPLKQQDIADCTGLTASYVNQILQDMRRRNLVHIGDGTLELRNGAELAAAAGFRSEYIQALPGPIGSAASLSRPQTLSGVRSLNDNRASSLLRRAAERG